MKMFLVTAGRHLGEVWFRNDEDFRVGMNCIAIIAFTCRVKVLAFVLMSNHIHIIICCEDQEKAKAFADAFKKRYSYYLRIKYGKKEFLRRSMCDIREIKNENESPERAIAYVQMNPVAANICSSPVMYPWGTGASFFNPEKPDGRQLKDFSIREQSRILRSNILLPPKLIITDKLFAAPESYIDIQLVESIFHTAKRFNYFLENSSKIKNQIKDHNCSIPSFSDQAVLAAIPDLYRSLFSEKYPGFSKETESSLSINQKILFIKQLKFRFSSDTGQLSRVTGWTESEIANLINAF